MGGSKSLYLLEVEEEEETSEEEVVDIPSPEPGNEEELGEVCEISVYALHGIPTFHTLRVEGYCQQRPLYILIDPRSSHNFMDEGLARELQGNIQAVRTHAINVVDGQTKELCKAFSWMMEKLTYTNDFLLLPLRSCDIILVVQWLLPLGDIKLNFQELTLGYTYQGHECVLKVHVDKVRTVEAKRLEKMANRGAQLFMIRVVPLEEKGNLGVTTPKEIVFLTREYPQLFAEPKGLPPSRGPFDHKIPLEVGRNPVNLRPYRCSSLRKDVIEKLIRDMLEQGIVQPSCSPYASPVVLVGKKDGSWRLCVDYRGLNKVTIKDKFPIPIIEELLEELGGSKIYSKIDLRAGYHQIRMANEDIVKTTFRTHEGHYEYFVMPFGLSNAPSSFQSLMNHVFREHLRKFILVFFDDILVFSQNLSEHLVHLKTTFDLLMKHKLSVRQAKCSFGASRVEYLGHGYLLMGYLLILRKLLQLRNGLNPRM